jgi:hypothetical protein
MSKINWMEFLENAKQLALQYPRVSGVLLCIFVIILVVWWRSRYIKITKDSMGSLRISKKVIRGMITETYKGIVGFRRTPIVKVRFSGGKIHFRLRVQIVDTCKVGESIEELQRKIYDRMQYSFGPNRVGNIHVRITRCFSPNSKVTQIVQAVTQTISREPCCNCDEKLTSGRSGSSDEVEAFKEWKSKW